MSDEERDEEFEENEDEEDVLDEEEDEMEEEEEEDLEDEGQSRSRKRRKKNSGLSGAFFLDTEAGVDEDDEEEEEAEEGFEKEAELVAAERSAIENRGLYRKRLFEQDKSEEELARELAERHKDYGRDDDEEDDEEAGSGIKQVSNLPSVRDPKLWMVKCKNGKERQTVMALMRKFLEKQNDEDRLLIKSVVSPEHLKGYIYIEAERENHVKSAIKGMRTLQEWNLKLVPIKEMVDVLAVTKKHIALKRGAWVRVKRGAYLGDIGQVEEYDEARGRVVVKLIPRLDYGSSIKEDDKKRKRMPARFFNPDDISKDRYERKTNASGEPYYVMEGNKFKDGYLLKAMNIKSLDVNNIVPSLEELGRFQGKGSDRDAGEKDEFGNLVGALKPRRKVTFVKGDTVTVVEGDLKHLMGTVETVDDNTVTIRPKHEELKDLLSFPASHLQKYFKRGDHVKVMVGRHEGETGLIIRLEDNTAIIFSDLNQQEIKVSTQDIQETTEVATGKVQLGNYELHDLVQINRETVGVIVRIEKDSFRVLDNNGNVQTVLLQEVGQKRNSPRDATAFDSTQSIMSIGDIVKVIDGTNKGKQGTIRHIFRSFVFLHSREMIDNNGMFVARTSHCAVLGGGKAAKRDAGIVPGQFVPQSPARVPMSPARTNKPPPQHSSAFGATGQSVNRRRRDDALLEKTVVIAKGQWKGYIGVVKEATDTTLRVELHTNCKKVTVNREDARLRDEANPDVSSDYNYPPKTPVWGDVTRTPMRGEGVPSTPMRYPNTPMRVPGTPVHGTAWDPTITNTPMRANTPSWEPDYSWTPSVSTPGGYQPYSPYTPGTTGQENTPADSHTPSTPGVYTPGSSYTEQRTPGDVTTPYGGYQPTTPNTPSGLGPHTPRGPVTPGDGLDSSERSSESSIVWQIPEAEVRVRGMTGVIRDTFTDRGVFSARVVLDSTQETLVVPCDSLERVYPVRKDYVKILDGELKGQVGVSMGNDGNDGIVKISGDIKILDMRYLIKYRGKVDSI